MRLALEGRVLRRRRLPSSAVRHFSHVGMILCRRIVSINARPARRKPLAGVFSMIDTNRPHPM